MPWPLPGPAPEGRRGELSSGECALLGARGAALAGPVVGAALAMMSWTAACRSRPRALGRAASARCSIGNMRAWGVYESGERYGGSCPTARLVNKPSQGFGVRARQWDVGRLPHGAGEGLARCEQSSTHGNLLLYKAEQSDCSLPPQKGSAIMSTAFLCVALLSISPAAASGDLLGDEELGRG